MSTLLHILFWTSLAVVVYTYLGYGAIVFVLVKLRRLFTTQETHTSPAHQSVASVSLIIAAYNEADCIREKIENSLQQHYPADLLEIIIITDGSNDETPAI